MRTAGDLRGRMSTGTTREMSTGTTPGARDRARVVLGRCSAAGHGAVAVAAGTR